MSDYIQVAIQCGSEEQKDLLLAELAGMDFEGFEEEGLLLKAFIPAGRFREGALRDFAGARQLSYTARHIAETNWNATWEAAFEPVVVGSFCAVRAGFHPPIDGVTHEIVITPKMSFGTGHHATTLLMIEAMRHTSLHGKIVFDFGTGTGILAILAEKMGAAAVVAIDNDEWSIRNGRENLLQNGCTKTEIYQAAVLPDRKFDIILANINRNVILDNLGSIKGHCLPGGTVILSGLLETDGPDVLAAAEREGLQMRSLQEKSGWIAIHLVPSR